MVAIRFSFKWIIVPLYYGSIICTVLNQCARELWGSCDVRKERLIYSSSCRACCQQKPWYRCFCKEGGGALAKEVHVAQGHRHSWEKWLIYTGMQRSLFVAPPQDLSEASSADILLEGCPRLGQFLPQLRHHFSFCSSPKVAFRTLNNSLPNTTSKFAGETQPIGKPFEQGFFSD